MKNKIYIRTIKTVFFMFAVFMLLSSCQQVQLNSEDKKILQVSNAELVPTNTAKEKTEASTLKDPEYVKTLDDFYKDYHSLRIQKTGQKILFDASTPLVYIFCDMLSKVQEVDMSVPEGEKQIKEFEYNHYDYRLKFEGAADILFTLKGNMFRFEGEKQLYILWGDSKPLWDRLIFDNKNNSVDVGEEKTKVMIITYKEDVNGDGVDENIELSYERGKSPDFKGDLNLSINGSNSTVLKGDEWSTKPYRTIGEMPEISFLQEQKTKSKAILVIYSWATNGIGSSGVANVYKYIEGQIVEVKVKEVEWVIKYKGKDTVSISFPTLHQRTTSMKIDMDQFKRFLGEKDSLKRQLEAKDTFYSHPLWYIVKDYNGDGQVELCSVSVLQKPPLALCQLYTYYKYKNGELNPVQAFVPWFFNDDEKKSYLMGSICDLIQFNGYLTIGDKGIMDENFKPAYEYTPSEIKRALQELQDAKILQRNGDRLYINY